MIIINPISALLYFISLGIDIVLFFLVVHFIQLLRTFNLLAAFDKAGEKLVDATTQTVSQLLAKLFEKPFSEKGLIAVGIASLSLINLILVWIAKSFV